MVSLNNRKKLSESELAQLLAQVESSCPLCGKPLFRTKKARTFKAYEVAHIYPLNPKPHEEALLKSEDKLSEDPNHQDNLIPLCLGCHGEFDKPRNLEEYCALRDHKIRLIEKGIQQKLWTNYKIEEEVTQILEKLYFESPDDLESPIEYDPKSTEEKFDESMGLPTRVKIRSYVASYYPWIRSQLSILDKAYPETSQIVSSQIKGFYLKQKQLGLDQQRTFESVVGWIHSKTKCKTKDGAEVLASFFIQNCEIFS